MSNILLEKQLKLTFALVGGLFLAFGYFSDGFNTNCSSA